MDGIWEVVWLSLIGITTCCGGLVGLIYATSHIHDDQIEGQWHRRTRSDKVNFYLVMAGRSLFWVPTGMALGALYGLFWPVTLIGAGATLGLCIAYQRLYQRTRVLIHS